jgi:predicted nucleic acid-binding protein
VLTRLPPAHRLSPADALTVLETNFLAGTTVVALDASTYSLLLHDAPGHGVSGGQTYDWVIASCAVKAKATILLTFNAKDFRALAIEGLDILVPATV